MLTNDEENKRQRSVKLCQLVYDRQIDSAIGFEIRKLLEEGVLIDYQDQNRNQKTALHLAVEKCDVICVKFLLRFKPSLEVADGDGKTPLELAESKGYQNILNVLLNSTFDVVNESFVEVIDFESLTRQKIEAIKSRPTFKVLKLTNCPTVKIVLEKITHRAYAATFNESSHLFFIAIETKETNIDNDHEFMKKVMNLRRPMIVQLTSSNSRNSKIYFKDEKMKDFVEITDTPQMTKEELNGAFQSVGECNLNLLVAALRSNLFGHFTGDLLNTKLNITEDQSEAENHFARSNALCHRFFKLFDEGPPQTDRIVAALSFKGDQSLFALLDLPFELKDEKLKLNENQQDLLSVVDDRNYDWLMLATELNNLDAVKLLLRCGCDFNRSGKNGYRASDICWEIDAFDGLAELIEADSPYPYHFATDELDDSDEAKKINNMTEAINSFHKNIEDGEIEEVKKFITSHPHIKHAYDTKNFCALTVALESDKVEIYSLLMSEGFEPGADDEYESALDEFRNKTKIRKSHRKYFKEALNEPHLKRLVEKSKLSFGSKERAKCSTSIRRMFDELNKIEEIIPILQICSTSENLRIVFDFNCDYVVDMVVETGSRSSGLVYPIEGSVYIGAKNHETEFCKVLGALIHELTHYAMKLTYENGCKPYDESANEKSEQFENVVMATEKICKANSVSTDSIVATVFSLYGKEVWHKELIVRVPQLLAHYKMNPKTLQAAEQNIPELFHFYRDQTLKDIERQSKVLLQEYLIGKINKQTGIVRKIKNLKVKFEKIGVIDLKSSVNVIASNAPLMTLAMLSQINFDNFHIFVSLEQVATGNVLEKITKVNAKESSTTLIVDCIGHAQEYPESLRKLLKGLKNIKTIGLVMFEAESLKVRENFPKIEFKNLSHKWAELTESSKVHLLDQLVTFQGVEMKLNELVEPSSEAMNFFPLGKLVNFKDFKVGSELHQASHKFYVARKLIKKGQAKAKSFEELLRIESRMRAMIISDEAGSGKSVALFEIAKSLHASYPDRWVQFVDLKRHIGTFKRIKDYEKIESHENFIVQNIFNNELEFDRELFLQMFRDGKTFVLFDGFDEISPNFKDLLLHVLKLFQPRSGNQLFIATRPHLEAELEGALGKFVFEIEKLSEEDQIDFLTKYLRSAEPEISHEDLEVLLNRLLVKFSEIATPKLIGLPLLMRMTAEIFEDPIKENLLHKMESLSITSVFDEFVEKHFLRWREKGSENEIPREEGAKFDRAGGVLEVHHRIAITHIFGEDFMTFEVDESDADKISRVGLIRFDRTDKTFQFIHETFAEYFVANFICFHLNRKNRVMSHDCSKVIEILIDVLCGSAFRVIRTFLDQGLEPTKFSPSETFCKSVANCLGETLKSRNCFGILENNLYASRDNLASLLLSIVKHFEKEVLLKVLQSKGDNGDTALHNAANYGSNAKVSTLCDIISTCTDNPKEIFQEERSLGNVLLTATYNRNAGVLTTLCENLNSVLPKYALKIMFHQKDEGGGNIIAKAANYSNDKVFLELISLLPNYLSLDEIKSLLRAVDRWNQNFFQDALIRDTNKSLKLKFDVVKEYFGLEDQKTFFYQTAPNMFLRAARNKNKKIFERLIESTCDVLSIDDVKAMLMQQDSEESNVLHIITEHGNEIVLSELSSLLQERLSDEEIRSLLLEVNTKGQDCFRLANNNTKLNLKIIRETIGNKLPIENQTRLLQQSSNDIDIIRMACGNYTNENVPLETIKRLLTIKKHQGWNAFHSVARDGNVDTWNKLISFARARFSVDEIKSFLFYCDNDGQNCLHLATLSNSNGEIIEAICETIRDVGLSVEDQNFFMKQRNTDKENVFQQAAKRFKIDKCYSLYGALGNEMSKEMLLSAGYNILLCPKSSTPADKETAKKLITFLQEVLTKDEIKNLLFEVDPEEKNFFHWPVEYLPKMEIKSVSEAIKAILSRDDQERFFGMRAPNVFHLAARNLQPGIFSAVHECLKDVLTEEKVIALIQEKNLDNKNILHLFCQYNTNEAFYDISYQHYASGNRLRNLLKVLKIVCDAEELKKILTCTDNKGSNCLHLAAQLNSQLFIEELFRFIRTELCDSDQRGLIQKYDNDGKNIFSCAFLNKDPGILAFVRQFSREIFTEIQIEELMTIRLESLKKINQNK